MPPRSRVECPVCGKDVSVARSGLVYPHLSPQRDPCPATGTDVTDRAPRREGPRPSTVATPDAADAARDRAIAAIDAAFTPQPPPNACGDPACGVPRNHPGKPKTGWMRVHTTDGLPDRWFCSPSCFAMVHRLITMAQPGAPRLADLNRLAGTHLTVMTATPDRIAAALDDAFAALVDEVDTQAGKDRRDRPAPIVADDGTVDPAALTATAEAIAG